MPCNECAASVAVGSCRCSADYRWLCPTHKCETPVSRQLYLQPPSLLCLPRYFAILGLGGDYVFSWMNFLGINLSIIGSLVYAHQEYVNRWVGG